MNFNTKGHFSTLNYDPSSGINLQRGQFFMRGGVVKKRGESLFNVENRPSIRKKLTRGVIFQRGHYLKLHRHLTMITKTMKQYLHFVLENSKF